MPVQTAAAGQPSAFWRFWDKTWWIFGLLFLAANAWAWNRHGPLTLLRFWAAFFAVSGAGIIWYGLRARRHAEESLHWLPVQALVVSSEVVRDEQRSLSGEAYDPARSMVYYHPEIEYEYEVEGRKYRSNRLIAVRVSWPKSDAEAWVAKYPAGAVVTARRHPQKPALAVLQPGIQGFEGRYRVPFFVGAVFLAAGAAGWVLFSRFD